MDWTRPADDPAAAATEPELASRVAEAQQRLCAINGLDVELRAERFLLDPAQARELLPPSSPRTGLAVLEEGADLWLGLYFDARDRRDPAAIVEETSHWLCVTWHARQARPVSRLVLELQAEVDRYALERLAGRSGLAHLEGVVWDPGLAGPERRRYEVAHRAARRYCRGLSRRFPQWSDVPGLLGELRRFYRAPSGEKLRG
jgi:hypothetical protein